MIGEQLMETTENNVTRAAVAKTGKSSGTGRNSKTGKTAGQTSKTGKTSAAKKPASSKKTDSGVKLSAAEKELIRNYRKCSAIEKKFVSAVTEKAATGLDFDNILGILKAFLG